MIRFSKIISIIIAFSSLNACTSKTEKAKPESKMNKLVITDIAEVENMGTIKKYELKNENGMLVEVLNFGGIVTKILVPDRDGILDDVTVGFENPLDYLREHPYFGAIVGRYGNRIAKGEFSIGGEKYGLATNNGANHLHGGIKGFDKAIWAVADVSNENHHALELRYTSSDGEEGYPGRLESKVIYTLTNNNELKVDYEAVADRPTHVNLTQHTYFNLGGLKNQKILNHTLTINADHYLAIDEGFIPLGELTPVEDTPFDFREAKAIGRDINQEHIQIERGLGYDHCWALNRNGNGLQIAAQLIDNQLGRKMDVLTTEPEVQFYTGNFLDESLEGKRGKIQHRAGLCLETQHFPDSPNQENFPSTLLKPGEKYETSTVFRFGVVE